MLLDWGLWANLRNIIGLAYGSRRRPHHYAPPRVGKCNGWGIKGTITRRLLPYGYGCSDREIHPSAAFRRRAERSRIIDVRPLAGRLLLRNLSERLHRARWGARADSNWLDPGTGFARAWHALNGRHGQWRSVLLYLPACRTAHRLHAHANDGSTSGRSLFRQEQAGRTPCRLRLEGRPGLRFREPHDPYRRQGYRLRRRIVQNLLVREHREQQQRHDIGDLDHWIDCRAGGVLVGISHRVAGHGRLVRLGALAAVIAVFNVFLGVIPGAAP